MDPATTGKGRSQFENDTGGFWWTVYLVHGIQKVRGSNPLGSTTTTSGFHQGPLWSWCRLRRRVLRGFRHDHGSRDDSDRVLPVSRRHEYGACCSDLAQHGRDRIDQGAAICARMASLQRGVGMRSGAADGLCELHTSAKRFGNLEAVSGGSGRWP